MPHMPTMYNCAQLEVCLNEQLEFIIFMYYKRVCGKRVDASKTHAPRSESSARKFIKPWQSPRSRGCISSYVAFFQRILAGLRIQ